MIQRKAKQYLSSERREKLRILVGELGDMMGDGREANAIFVRMIGMEREELTEVCEAMEVLKERLLAGAAAESCDRTVRSVYAFAPSFAGDQAVEVPQLAAAADYL